jgi:hypothetical protein
MKKSLVLAGFLGVSTSVMFTGCATLFGGGSNQSINIKSDKEMVYDIYKVEVVEKDADGKVVEKKNPKEPKLIHANMKVPSNINVDRSNEDILLKSKNEECKDIRVEKKLNNWFWGDVLATSLLSTTVDAVTGAMWEYDKEVTVECK